MKVLPVLAVFAVAVCGCKQLDSDVSSDGKTVAIAGEKGLRIRSTEGRDLNIVVGAGEVSAPRWSRSDNRVAYIDAKHRLSIYSLPDRKAKVTAWTGEGPIAWSSSDKKLAFVQRTGDAHVAMVIDPKSERSIGVEPLGTDDVRELNWTPSGSRLLATLQTSLMLVGGDKTTQFVFDGDVQGAAILDDDHFLALLAEPSGPANMPDAKLVKCDAKDGAQTVVGEHILRSRIPEAVRLDGWIQIGAISPDGSRLACIGILDRHPDHLLRQIIEDQKTKKLSDKQIDAMFMRANLESFVLVFDLAASNAVVRLDLPNFDIRKTDGKLQWSSDGKSLAIVSENYGRIWKP